MKKNIITISREFGSGGRTIGKTVAERLGVPCYDKELVKQVALESGFDPKFIEERGESAPGKNRFAYAFLGRGTPGVMGGMSASDFLWTIQYRVIQDLAEKGLAADQIVLTVGYDIDNLRDARRRKEYRGEVKTDRYGRKVPKHAHGTSNLTYHTSSARQIIQAVTGLFDRIVDPKLLIRRITISAEHVIPRNEVEEQETCGFEQMTLFTDYAAREKEQEQKKAEEERESRMQEAVLEIRRKFGKNALLRGMDLQEGATAKDRNSQIGGHRA